MKAKQLLSFYLIVVAVLFSACQKKRPIRAFYSWENNKAELTDFEKSTIENLALSKLYVKVFEVDVDETNQPIPNAVTKFNFKNELKELEFIPTVFIRNDVFKKASSEKLAELPKLILHYTKKKFQGQIADTARLREIQIDCDWTESTKEKYMDFLRELKSQTKLTVSVTLRLYPYKFPDKMKVPPVDKALLMCYNLMSIHDNRVKNSILDLDELTKYLKGAKKYPLPLDIGLPIYRNMHVYQNNQFTRSLHQADCDSLYPYLTHQKGLWYSVNEDVKISGFFLRKGDKVKYEYIDENKMQKAIEIIKKYVRLRKEFTISFYQLNESDVKNQGNEELVDYFTAFSQ